MAKKRICLFTETFGVGGIEAFITSVTENMPEHDAQIDVVASVIERSAYTERLSELGVSFTELSGRLRFGGNFPRFRKLLSERRYDIIHFNLFQGAALGFVKIAEAAGVPRRLVHAHGAGLRGGLLRPLKLIIHKIGRCLFLDCASELFACSRSAGEFLFGKDKSVRIIKNGIDTERFAYSDEKRHEVRMALGAKEELLVGCIGRLSKEKNQQKAIKVFAELKKLRSDARLILAGDGPMAKHCKRLIDKLGISESVSMLGNIQDTDRLLSAMDVFIMPSTSEGLGIALIEAETSGLGAVVSNKLPPEAIINENVTALPLGAHDSVWAEAILGESFSENRGKYKQRIKDAGFDIADTARQIKEIYAI